MDYEYTAKLPSEEGKAKSLGGGKPKPTPKKVLTTATMEDPHDREMMNRVMKRVKLSSPAWQALREDLDNNEPKTYISRRFGIKPSDLKWIKKYLGYV